MARNALQIKPSARVFREHFDEEMIPVWQAILETFPPTTDGCLWVTEGHREGSGLHPRCRALDIRVRNLAGLPQGRAARTRRIRQVARRLADYLGADYDVVAHEELVGRPQEHIHIEHDPRGG